MAREFKLTSEAYQKFAQVLADLEASKKLFEQAGEPLPEQLREFFGVNRSNGRSSESAVSIPYPRRKSHPVEATDDWISVELSELSATSLVLAVLRAAAKPVIAKDVIEMVTEINPHIPRGSIHNIGTRLGGKLINRTDDGWSLIDPSKAGIISDGYLWGPKDIFDKTEIAAHRREAILCILKGFQSGLQTVQIVDQLRGTKWMQAPASKDLVKGDMDLLEAHNRVRRISNSRKWVVRED
jgi:hypothetical protein